MEETVILLKLVTGEEVIATLVNITEDFDYRVKNAYILMKIPTQTGGIAISLAPFMFVNETSDFEIKKNAIVAEAQNSEISEDLKTSYFKEVYGIDIIQSTKIIKP